MDIKEKVSSLQERWSELNGQSHLISRSIVNWLRVKRHMDAVIRKERERREWSPPQLAGLRDKLSALTAKKSSIAQEISHLADLEMAEKSGNAAHGG
ncbi:MAG: hypothetical protein WCV82_03775 [Candidatus Paceibacterota bacterium]|jgi:hypothetical protein